MSLRIVEPAHVEDVVRSKRSVHVDVAIVCSVGAAFAHLVAAPGHYLWWPASGLFFVGLGLVQLVVAVALVYGVDDRRFVLAAVWGTVGVIVLYVASRTVGLPMAPPVPFHGERWIAGQSMVPDGAKYVGPLDVLTLAAELGFVCTTLTLLPARSRNRTINALMALGLALGTAGLVAAFA